VWKSHARYSFWSYRRWAGLPLALCRQACNGAMGPRIEAYDHFDVTKPLASAS
jgi:hypothetical protein